MKVNDIPVRVVGPGSQDIGDTPLSYIDMPSGMSTYVPPARPSAEALESLAGACETMNWLRAALADHDGDGSVRADLSALDAESRDIVNQILGEGEVSITYEGEFRARTQESVLAGVWRTFVLDGDTVVADILEVAAVPQVVLAKEGRDDPINAGPGDAAEGMTNALSILVELESRLAEYAGHGTQGIVNLSLLPLSEPEVEFIDERLGRGPVDVLSRAYGKCQVISTCTEHVWWVRYYNSMNTPILNTIEVTRAPAVVGAAPEDIRDSAVRLEEILAPYDLDAA